MGNAPLPKGCSPVSRYRTQVREVINRNAVVSLALEQGFLRKVQLEGRWMIDKKYVDRDIWMAFPIGADWYLMPYDLMLEHEKEDGKTLKSASWMDSGAYSKPNPSASTIAACAPYKFTSIAEIAAEAADDVQ